MGKVIKRPATISFKKLDMFLKDNKLEHKFNEWYKTLPYKLSFKYANFTPTEAQWKAYVSWCVGEMGLNQIQKVLGVSGSSIYTVLAYMGRLKK